MTTGADLLVRTSRADRRAADALLRRAAAALGSVPVSQVEVGRQSSGAPFLGGAAEGLHCSVSHTDGLVAVAVSRLGPVGVDAEALRPLPARQLSARWFAPEESAWLAGEPAERTVIGFLALWTAKEAIGKLHGRGLRGGGMSRPVPLPRLARLAVDWAPVVDTAETCAVVVGHRQLGGHILAVASVATVIGASVDLP